MDYFATKVKGITIRRYRSSATRDDRKNSSSVSSRRSLSRDRHRERRDPYSTSPYTKNGHRSSSRDHDRDRHRDRLRIDDRDRDRSLERDRKHRHHTDEYVKEEKIRKYDSSKEERKYKDKHIHEKSYRRSYTPDRKR